MLRADAFAGEQRLLMELVGYVESWVRRLERLETRARLLDYTAPYRRDGRYSRLTGRSQALAAILQQLELFRTTRSEAPVLILGEPGSGRSVLAAELHRCSPRSGGPLRQLDCTEAGRPDFEHRLFGDGQDHSLRQPGELEKAHGGTLILQNVEHLPPVLQARLLKVLQERRLFRNNGDLLLRLDVRLLSTSRLNFKKEGAPTGFNQELAERLSLFDLTVPSLRTRREDILPLAEQLLNELRPSGRTLAFTASALQDLERHSWPGNVAELRRTIQQAIPQARANVIDSGQLLRDASEPVVNPVPAVALRSWKIELDDFQRHLIRTAMEQNHGNVTRAASCLHISRQYLNNRLRILGMSDLRSLQPGQLDEPGDEGDDEMGGET
jgi:DNA-binding NtrC family response regulator